MLGLSHSFLEDTVSPTTNTWTGVCPLADKITAPTVVCPHTPTQSTHLRREKLQASPQRETYWDPIEDLTPQAHQEGRPPCPPPSTGPSGLSGLPLARSIQAARVSARLLKNGAQSLSLWAQVTVVSLNLSWLPGYKTRKIGHWEKGWGFGLQRWPG